jgi:hypothetical protein
MALLGSSALAMWWDIAPGVRADFEHWHTHEHFPERLAIPGFLRASRWSSADGGEGFFVLYELQGHEVLSSPPYLARLNAPTPWSQRLMPEHRNMVRTQCRVLESQGPAIARHVLTVRLSPASGRDAELRSVLRALAGDVAQRPGLAGLHLLRHEPPAIAATQEQKIRGLRDAGADWVLVASGYDPAVLGALASAELGETALERMGAASGSVRQVYALSATATPGDTL